MKLLQMYCLCVMIFFLYFLYDIVIKKSIEKSKGKKYINFVIIAIFSILGIFQLYHLIDDEYSSRNSFHKVFDEPFKKSYEIIKLDGKTYAILDVSYTLGKYIIAEAKYNENEDKGMDITIDYSQTKMIDKNDINVRTIEKFNKMILKNKDFYIVKGKNLVYIYGSTYKIENQNDNDITINLKTGKQTRLEKLVPRENNTMIPENYLEDNGEKNLIVLFK